LKNVSENLTIVNMCLQFLNMVILAEIYREKQIEYYLKDIAKEKRECAGGMLLPYYVCSTK